MCGDDEQESAGGILAALATAKRSFAQLFSSLQSEEVYAASALCLSLLKSFLKTD